MPDPHQNPEQQDIRAPQDSPSPRASSGTQDGPGTDRQKPSHRARILHDLAHPASGQLIVAIILCLCSFAVVTQVRSRADEDPFASMRRADLVTMLDSLSTSSRQLDSELAELRDTQRQLQSGADSRQAAQKQAATRLSQLQVLSGTVPVQGPGITIRIADPGAKVTSDILLDAVEELRDAGAEAISLNGKVRVVASTWFASGADSVIASGTPISRPITIQAIGDPHSLEEGARFRGGLVSQVQAPQVGGSVQITSSTLIRITAVATPAPMTHASPVR
ncbi:DUF881 domain-containing protein [Acidipropionibacterium jensenii]|uniref:Bacterial protein of uncharacterized function (DUF881) n=1 Tax=Acidipropionibacterium jensenii TaxID=1749 RepID=A0A3S4WV24_9ACTN|nr:DUF881 domain-containing protein [Acidipropionibacterium jensenii]AZZ42212.1 DUF881 domain-containing protein [Acidipropionibacterium jensenii]MDN5976467.1 DUF881 domain-containing protein [Acidipropionibacterium jensenii]MDN5996427.1 DUF881 domain-containing protein [Acidipropionibacterium jensenii]MDN6425766.1 DUF881 domain-containing protein [Acidipropionibacterium jensenii]MDN6441546.1 DUF881 domain-containing protein [Acidipropionibacterium jensenii]